MVKTGLLDTAIRPANSVLNLDKSTEPWHAQITNLSSILGLDLDDAWRHDLERKKIFLPASSITVDPRVDWALRWLLKKLDVQNGQLSEPCKTCNSWLLLRELIARCPTATVARLLRANHFVTKVETTILFIRDATAENLENSYNEHNSEAQYTPKETMSKKRKRPGSDSPPANLSIQTPNLDALFMALCGAFGQAMALTKQDPDRPQDYATEHMKHALKCAPQSAANILGSAFYVANDLLQSPKRSCTRTNVELLGLRGEMGGMDFQSSLSPLVELWDLQLSRSHECSAYSSHRAYMSTCTVPSLQLLQTCQDWENSENDMKNSKEMLERLLRDHVVLPTRNASLLVTRQTASDDSEVYPPLSDDLILSLKARPLAHKLSGNRADSKTKDHMQLSLLSLLFSLAVSCRPRSTQTLRHIEDAWLEKLFLQLDIVGAPDLRPVPLPNAPKSHRRLLRWLLELAVNENVNFSVHTLEQTLETASGLFENYPSQNIDWIIISLCLSIDADVFVIPNKEGQVASYSSYRPPNKNLKALLEALTKCQISEIEERHYIISHTMISLLDGFVRARDLPGFLGHWKEQLDLIQHEERRNSLQLSLWEEDALQKEVASRIETLAGPQILNLLSNLPKDLQASNFDSSSDSPSSLQWIICHETIFSGLAREENSDRVADVAESSFVSIAKSLRKAEINSSPYQWRLWRTMTTIIQRWPPKQSHSKISDATSSAIRRAWNVVKRTPLWAPDCHETQSDFDEHYQAFQFIICCGSIGRTSEKETLWSLQKAEKALQRLLDVMHPFCQRVENDIWGKLEYSGQNREIFVPGANITSLEALYPACVSCIISNFGVLRVFKAQIHSRLIEQLYYCALFHCRTSLPLPSGSIDYVWPWKQLTRLMALMESTQAFECMKAFQIRVYLQASQFQDPKNWNINSVDYSLAFESLNAVPINHWSSGQRKAIANRLLRILTTSNMDSLVSVTAHLVALQKFIQKPSKSMDILSNMETSSKDEPEPKSRSVLALLEIARFVDERFTWSVDTIDCVDAFERLAETITKYLFSTLDRVDSVNYVRALYASLATSLESRYGVGTCGSAFTVVACAALTAFHEHRDNLSEIFQDDTIPLQTTRQFHLESLLLRIGPVLETSSISYINENKWIQPQHNLGIDLACMASYIDLLRVHPNLASKNGSKISSLTLLMAMAHISVVTSKLSDLSNALRQPSRRCMGPADERHNGLSGPEYVAIRLARLEMSFSYGDDGLAPYLIGLLGAFDSNGDIEMESDPYIPEKPDPPPACSPKAKDITLLNIQNAVSTLRPPQKAGLLTSMTEGSTGGKLSNGMLYLMRTIILSIGNEDVEEIRSAISKACTLLYSSFGQDINYRPALISMQCLSAFLQRQARSVTQWHIDNVLSTIGIISHLIKGKRAEKHSGMLYTGLCRLLDTILRMHRAKIGGRYHLVLPALQGLVGCLFTPYIRTDQDLEPEIVFTERHAADYARILTMLCDPTVSSVTRSKKRSRTELNDETKKARSIAGQHLQYLIMEYCGCQLEGRILPEMRSALNVGLWAVLEVMNKDVMRTMNAAMDQDRRSVFKSLYDDFRRFGKWQGG